jgi:FkbM family methyltransferase
MRYSISTFKNWSERVRYYGIRNSLALFNNLRKDGCFVLKRFGNDFYLRGNTVDFAVFNSIFAKGEYDINIGFKPEYIIDAGAFTGISAVFFSHKYPEAKIIAVEPEKSNFDLLVRNTKPYKNILCVNGGLYGEDVSLVISDSAVEKYAFRVERCSPAEGSLPGYSIETLMKKFQLPHIDILKMDIEGAEYSVFKHNSDSWLPAVKVLITELHEFIYPGVSEFIPGVLRGSGFRIQWKGENLIALRDISANVNELPPLG